MMIKTTSVLASMVVTVSFAADQMDQSTNQESSKDEWAIPAQPNPLPSDILSVVLSFCTPLQWSQIFSVNHFFNDLIQAVITEFKQAGWDFEYSSNLDISERMDQLLQQPVPSKTLIANKDNLVMLHVPDTKEHSQSVTPKVKITGVQLVKQCSTLDHSDCEHYFTHRSDKRTLIVRNMETDEDLTLEGTVPGCWSKLVNKNQVVCMSNTEIWLYQLDWESKIAERVQCKNLECGTIHKSCVVKNQCGEAESVLFYGGNKDRMGEYDLIKQEFRWTKEVKGERQFVPGGKTVIIRNRDQLKVESTDGITQLLCLPKPFQSNVFPSPDGRYALFLLSTKQRVLQNLHSGVLTYIDAPKNPHWLTSEIFRVGQFSGPTYLRSVKNPGINLMTLNDESKTQVGLLEVGSVVEAKNILFDAIRIGPNIFRPLNSDRVIQLEWF